MKKKPVVLAGKEDVASWINAWVGPLVAGLVLLIIGVALFAQIQTPAGKHRKARVRVTPKVVAPVAASGADAWNSGAPSQQTGNSLLF